MAAMAYETALSSKSLKAQVYHEPKLNQWPALVLERLLDHNDLSAGDFLSKNDSLKGFLESRSPVTVWTGHQASLWHPGIWIKYLSAGMTAFFTQQLLLNELLSKKIALKQPSLQTSSLSTLPVRWSHVVVDHDVYHPWSLQLPWVTGGQNGGQVMVQRFDAVSPRAGWAACAYLGVETKQWKKKLDRLVKRMSSQGVKPLFDLDQLVNLWEQVPLMPRLVDQSVWILRQTYQHILNQYVDSASEMMSVLKWPDPQYTLDLLDASWVERLLHDPVAMAWAHNEALDQVPLLKMRPLHLGYELVELPLWQVVDGYRRRVYAQAAVGGQKWDLVDDRGQTLDWQQESIFKKLAPKAVLMTAMLRSKTDAGLFVHGTGGGLYDQLTDIWCNRWLGQKLAPMTVATSNMYLPMDVPVADESQKAQAVWQAHHAPHNVDRLVGLKDGGTQEKKRLLEHMGDDRNRARRQAAYDRIQSINFELRQQHADILQAFENQARQAIVGVQNQKWIEKRDWFLGLYPVEMFEPVFALIQEHL